MRDLPCCSEVDVDADVLASIRTRLTSCPYGHQFHGVTWKFQHGQLTLHGAVSSYYMKQVLQTVLRDVQHVERLVNEVHVVGKDPVSVGTGQ
jgi:hypothetical protein